MEYRLTPKNPEDTHIFRRIIESVHEFISESADGSILFISSLNLDEIKFPDTLSGFKIELLDSEINHPARYNQYPIEVIDMMEKIWGKEAVSLWCVMTAFKYRMRLGHKDAIDQELEKERWYLERSKKL